MASTDTTLRILAFDWLQNLTAIHGDVLPRNILEKGFIHNGEKITLLGPKGIWKPRSLEIPLSITTVTDDPYKDYTSPEGLLLYKHRGTDTYHHDNTDLRKTPDNPGQGIRGMEKMNGLKWNW